MSVEAVSKNLPSIATKSNLKGKKPSGFVNFFENLGKTETKKGGKNQAPKGVEKVEKNDLAQNLPQNTQKITKNLNKNISQTSKNPTKKDVLLKNLLNNPPRSKVAQNSKFQNNNITPQEQIAQSPQTPQDKAAPKISPNLNPNIIKTALSDSTPQITQTLDKNLTSENATPKSPKQEPKTQQNVESKIQDIKKPQNATIKNEIPAKNEIPTQTPKIVESSKNDTKQNTQIIEQDTENTEKIAPKMAQNGDVKEVNESEKPTPKIEQNMAEKNPTEKPTETKTPPSNEVKIDKDIPKIAQNTANQAINQNITQNTNTPTTTQNTSEESKPKFTDIGIKNTLKYSAFKAFDALSLLKPSDGKKLSDIIKKADELALNLNKIKLEKEPLKIEAGKNKLEVPKAADKTTENQKVPNPQNTVEIETKNVSLQKEVQNQLVESQIADENVSEAKFEPLKEMLSESRASRDSKDSSKDSNQDKNPQNEPKNRLDSKKISEDSTKNTESIKTESTKTESLKEPKIAQNELRNEQNKASEKITQDLAETKPVAFKPNEMREIAEKKDDKNVRDVRADLKFEPQNLQADKVQQRIFDSKETIRSFVANLGQEISNYKPPITKLTLELNPANLGNIEVSITHQGKNIQVQLHSNQNALNLLMQNHAELRNTLSQIGYENVVMSFSNGSSMSFSDGKGQWHYQEFAKNFSTNGEISNGEDSNAVLDIMLVGNYA